MKKQKPTNPQRIERLKKHRRIMAVTIILLLSFSVLVATAKFTCTKRVVKIVKPDDNFCWYMNAYIKNNTGSTVYYYIVYRINQDGEMRETDPTTDLEELTQDVTSLYINEQITINQYWCLLAGIKGHELKSK